MGSYPSGNSSALDSYRRLYGLEVTDLLEPGGAGRAEDQVIVEAAVDYQRDRTEAFEIRAAECALIVVDMQEDFVRPGGPMWVPQAQRIVGAVRSLTEVCRSSGVPVIFTATTYIPGYPNDSGRFSAPLRSGTLAEGSAGVAVVPELIAPGEHVIEKHTYDAFYGTDLDGRLRSTGTRTVIVSGTLTNYCCEATARGAFDRGYHVVFGSDINATDTAIGHEATLQTIRRGYGRVLTGARIEAALRLGDEGFAAGAAGPTRAAADPTGPGGLQG